MPLTLLFIANPSNHTPAGNVYDADAEVVFIRGDAVGEIVT